jgi:hypothetical protein
MQRPLRKNGQPATEGPFLFPDQSHISKMHLLEMSLLVHEIVTADARSHYSPQPVNILLLLKAITIRYRRQTHFLFAYHEDVRLFHDVVMN